MATDEFTWQLASKIALPTIKASQNDLTLLSQETHARLSQEDHNLLYVHCKMKPDAWSIAASHIKAIDYATGVQRIMSQEAMTAALKRWNFSPLVIDKHDHIQRVDDVTFMEELHFMRLSMQDETSKLQRENIDRALGIESSAPKT